MAEEVKDTKEEGKTEGGEKLVAFKLLKPLGENAEGDVIYVPEAIGDALVSEGVAELATEDDMGGEEEEATDETPEEAPMVQNSINRLSKKIEKSVSTSVAKAIEKAHRPSVQAPPTVPAQFKTEPAYKSNGAMIRGIFKALYSNDPSEKTQHQNRVMECQQQIAKAWTDKLGIVVKAPLGINETTTTQGGFLVNPSFSPDVFAIEHGQIDLQSQCQAIEAQSNVYNQRYVNESSLANGSIFGGLNTVATAEGASFTSSLPAWANVAFTLQKLAIFNYYTTEVLQDASYPVEQELDEYIAKAFLYSVNTQIIQGTTLEGALNAPSLVSVTHSSNDTAYHTTPSTNLTYADLAAIWSRVYPDSQVSPKGMWLFHPSLTNPLTQMTYTFSGANPAWGIQYSAENGLSGQGPLTPYRIFGKPAYPSWACSAPGNAGDILYVDFNTFRLFRKPFRVEVSKEFQFGTDQVAVRACWRGDCKTIFRSTVQGPTGSDTFSAIVTRTGGLT